ncbi:hypothetical protein SDC9_193167 [bioreactor metagenome]|uniref:Uncharacterized protein n=1 Tax=bioreactor metagenome TaxID=1076179 RepID=A0A645I395_9ZZZZ
MRLLKTDGACAQNRNHCAGRRRERNPNRRSRDRRYPRGKTRRKNPRRRHGARGAHGHRRIDADRREHAGGQTHGRYGIRRVFKRQRCDTLSRGQDRRRYRFGADHQAGGGCARIQSAHRETCGCCFRLFCADRMRNRNRSRGRMVSQHAGCRIRTDDIYLSACHRLPMRSRPGHADRNHGGHRQRRGKRNTDQERRGARNGT